MPKTLIAAASRASAEAAKHVADAGGNAVDAAIAATVAAMTSELGIVSPGAGAYITIWPPEGDPLVIDAYVEMPGRGLAEDHESSVELVAMEYGGGLETYVGWGSVATPGAFAGLSRASRLHGRAPWALTLEPSITLARDGFAVTSASAYYLGYSHNVVYGWDDEAAAIYHRDDGAPVASGDIVRIPDLGDTLVALGEEGAELLYLGDLGRALVEASAERGGLITRADLEAYDPVVREPLRTDLHGWDIATNAPPAVGGATVAALIAFLEHLDVSGWAAGDVAKYAAAQDAVFSFRRADMDGDVDRFAATALLMDMAQHGDLSAIHRSPSTVHVSAVDETGLACAITSSAGYGSGAVIPGTGFGLNNCLGEIELTTEGLHALSPGQRLLSNMAPTVAQSPDGETLAIGSPGADRITSAIASVLLNHIVCSMPLEEAVSAPRIHAEVFNGTHTLAVEPGVDVSAVEGMKVRRLDPLSMYFGGVQAAAVTESGALYGAADPRRDGTVVVGGSSD